MVNRTVLGDTRVGAPPKFCSLVCPKGYFVYVGCAYKFSREAFFIAVGKGTLMTVFKAFSFALKDFAAIVV